MTKLKAKLVQVVKCYVVQLAKKYIYEVIHDICQINKYAS